MTIEQQYARLHKTARLYFVGGGFVWFDRKHAYLWRIS